VADGVPGARREVEGERGVSEQEASPAVEAARAELAAAIMAAGQHLIAGLDGATAADHTKVDRLLEEIKFRWIVLDELLIEEGQGA